MRTASGMATPARRLERERHRPPWSLHPHLELHVSLATHVLLYHSHLSLSTPVSALWTKRLRAGAATSRVCWPPGLLWPLALRGSVGPLLRSALGLGDCLDTCEWPSTQRRYASCGCQFTILLEVLLASTELCRKGLGRDGRCVRNKVLVKGL